MAAIATPLRNTSRRVLLIEGHRAGRGATGHNAGQLASYLEGQTGLVGLGGGSGDHNYQTAPSVNIAAINGVPADTVYKLTKAMWDNLPALVAAHSAGKAIKRENALAGMAVPLHPGAEKYYREVGLIK